MEDDLESLKAEMGLTEKKEEAEAEKAPAPVEKKKKKKGKKGKAESDDEDDETVEEPVKKTASAFSALAIDDDSEEEEEEEKPKAKAEEKPKAKAKAESDNSDNSDDDDDDDHAGGTVKTAAQKKAEKKERERLKKLKQKQKSKKKPQKKDEEEDIDKIMEELGLDSEKKEEKKEEKEEKKEEKEEKKEEKKEDLPAQASSASQKDGDDDNGEDDDNDDNNDEGGSSNKKKKKKKKKGAAATEDKKEKKMPSKMAQLIKEQLAAKEAEEARLKAEAEAKQRAIEEEERRIAEEERLAEERRLAKKQREKEKKERMKKEGTYMTKAERERQAVAQQKLEQMKAQGIIIAALEDGEKKKRPVYGKKTRNKKKAQADTDSASSLSRTESETLEAAVGEASSTPDNDAKDSDKEEEEEGEEEEEEAEAADSWEVVEDWEQADTATIIRSVDELAQEKKKAEKEAKEAKKKKEEEKQKQKEEEEAAAAAAAAAASAPAMSVAERKRIANELKEREIAMERQKDLENLRAPIVVVMGHVDTGKTKLLDKIRRSNVQDGEAGGITQQIGATRFPVEEIQNRTKCVEKAQGFEFKVPGLLIIDTPGHESFANLRSRGSSLCDIAVLVIDIMHGLEPQTIESLEMLRSRKTPFIIALNKIDRLNGWKAVPWTSSQNTLKQQSKATKQHFETLTNKIKVQLAELSINTELWYDNQDERHFVNIVPTSAHTGEGVPDLLFLLVSLTQKRLAGRLALSENLDCTVLEVKRVDGYGTTIDVILANGYLKEGDTIVLAGLEGPIVTTIRSLLMPQPLKELRVKNKYQVYKEIRAANGVKIAAKDLEKAVAGLPLRVAHSKEEVEVLVEEAEEKLEQAMASLETTENGVSVQASTLGSLEALLAFLKSSKIPVSSINIGPVHKRDITKCSIQLERDRKYACVLAFDVPIDRDAQAMADDLGIKIFPAEIIYHLFDKFTQYLDDLKKEMREQFKHIAIFPCRLRILPDCVFNARDPIVVGVVVEEGLLRQGTRLCVPSQDFCDLGAVASLEFNHKEIEIAKKGMEVCIKIDPAGGDKKMVGRHFQKEDELVSKISRESIDAVKEYFKEDLTKDDWRLMKKLKENVFKFV